MNFLPLIQSESELKELKTKIANLMESSYYVDRSKAEKRINSFLKIQRHAVENKAIRLNTEGINYKL